MRAAKKAKFDKKTLHDLVPLNALSESRFGKIAEKIHVDEVKAGHYLFRKGDRDSKSVYLLEGKIDLIDGFRKITAEVEAGTDMARYPVANLQPRALSARAARKSVVAYIDSNLLDVFLSCDQSQTPDVVEISGADTGDWMTRVLQSEVFSKLPPAKIQSLLMKMRPFPVQAGDVVIRQGDEGDYFYTIHEGRCAVTRRESQNAEDVLLAELGDGDSFGEDSLVSNTRRNATVTMLTDGTLMRLAKQDFLELLKKQLVRHIDLETAYVMVDEGAVWLDVRTLDEYERGSFEDSVNIPLAGLREELSELVFNATYILCCDTGGRSGSAAFMLSHKGYDVYVLEGGIAALAPEELASAGMPLQQVAGNNDVSDAGSGQASAEVIEFEAGRRDTDSVTESAASPVPGGTLPSAAEEAAAKDNASFAQDALLAELQQEKSLLVAEIDRYRDTERRLTEQLDLLRAELGETGEKLGEFYAQAKTHADEKKSLQEQYAGLQDEFNEQQQAYESRLDETTVRLAELQSQLDSVRLEAQTASDAANKELDEARADKDCLENELTTATQSVSLLESQLASALESVSLQEGEAEARLQEQRDSMQQLQAEIQLLGEANEQLQQKLAAASEREQSTGNELQNQLREMETRFEGLSAELAGVREQLEKKDAELESESRRSRELDQANQDLKSTLESSQESIRQLQEESGSTMREQREYVEQLRAEVAQAMDANEHLRTELEEAIAAKDKASKELKAMLDDAAERDRQAGGDLADLQRQLDESADRLATEQDRAESLQQQNKEQIQALESLQAEIDLLRDERESAAVVAREQQQALENDLDALKRELDSVTGQSRETAAGLESAAEIIQTLEQEKETLNSSLQEAESRLAEQVDRATLLEKEKQEAIESLSAQGEANDAERHALSEQLETAQQTNVQLQTELESWLEDFSAETKRLEEELEQQLAKNSDSLAEHDARLSGMQEAKEKSEAELAALHAELQELQQNLAAEREEKAGLLARAETLGAEYASELEGKDRQIEEIRASLQAGQDEVASLLLALQEKNIQLDALQQEISSREESRQLIEERLESSREQNKQIRLELEQYEQHAREAEEEYRETIRKAHDDLTRKNDNEKELQGQIDRLRKQLEQATLDQHRQRESAQENLDNVREQLHAERRARAEERAEMAARQRELKEQLASIATEHETNLGSRSGALEEARDAIRAEEQERLRAVLEAQAQTEDQLQKLQQELCKAHEEISELNMQQKTARQVDVDLLQEQNQQAVSTIAQLESQLRQLSEERDSALEEQNDLRERMSALRGEVEVARGLMNMHGQGQAENPARLRSELEEARKNVEIAVRLRAEAEAARDRILKERDQLRSQLDGGNDTATRLHDPAPDGQPAGKLDKTEPVRPDTGPVVSDQERPARASSNNGRSGSIAAGSRSRWLGPGIGLGVSGIVALLVWLMLGTENPLSGDLLTLLQPAEISTESKATPNTKDEPAVSGGDSVQPAVSSGKKPAAEPVQESASATPVQPAEPATTAVAAVRSFRDALQGGARGPVMMELPAGSYKMGSLGNSLNYDESPRHKVTLAGFSISKYEVTFAEYDRFARATGRRLPYDESWGRGSRPVVNVSWQDAVAYTEWLSRQSGKSYRLPTEAEWEYAVRAGGVSRHWWDDEEEGVYANCFNCGSKWDNRQTSPVGSFPANRFGLHDMAGNVQEWTQDCYQTGYADASPDGRALLIPECTQRSVRGGGYTSPLDTLRSARRGQYDQDTRLDNIGFRVVRDN
jgi:formylglycine-generating enzyme required for sulfatase activity/CRP-like cAMP-binding protein/chromosome segregation ATPase